MRERARERVKERARERARERKRERARERERNGRCVQDSMWSKTDLRLLQVGEIRIVIYKCSLHLVYQVQRVTKPEGEKACARKTWRRY